MKKRGSLSSSDHDSVGLRTLASLRLNGVLSPCSYIIQATNAYLITIIAQSRHPY